MKTWKNAIKKIALGVIVALMLAATIICSAGALNYASATEQGIYIVAGVLNLIFGFGALYFLIQKAQKMDVINPTE